MLRPGEKAGEWDPVEDVEEARKLKAMYEKEAADAQRMKQENEELARRSMHQDRRRAGNHLEAINDFNNN